MIEQEMSFTDFEFEEEKLRDLVKKGANALDHQLKAQFYKHAELDAFRTRESGRKIFTEFVYIRILMPANRLTEIERRATDEDKLRFPQQYAAFLKGAEQLSAGTPLKELPTITPVQVMELKALKVDTIEQLAGMPDPVAQVLGTGGLDLKKRAQVFLARFTANDTLATQVQELQAQLNALMAERALQTTAAPEVKVTAGGIDENEAKATPAPAPASKK